MGKKKALLRICSMMLMIASVIVFQTELPACKETVKKETGQETKARKYRCADVRITVRIIPSVNKTYGYEILVNGKPFIHQPNIPALPGNKGFATPDKAAKAAEFVSAKIRNNDMPPVVTVDDLNRMGVLK